MVRKIISHMVSPLDDCLEILVCDEPGSGGANHVYQIVDVSKQNTGPDKDTVLCEVSFQNGPIKEAGLNGVTHEALIAIVMDRLQAFQAGPYQCQQNAVALHHLHGAMTALQSRTKERLNRGVEGTHQV